MKTVEGLLEKGLIEVANKEEELKVSKSFALETQSVISECADKCVPLCRLQERSVKHLSKK